MRQRKVYLDTNIFIQAFEGDPRESGHLRAFFEFALQTECKYFVSADKGMAHLPDAIRYISPDADSIHNLMEALRA